MLRVRYLFYLGLFCYLLDLHQIGSDALSLLPKKKDKSESAESDKNAKENVGKAKEQEVYKMSLHDKSRETESGEHLQYPFNPHCSWLKIVRPIGLQSNCLLNDIIGIYKTIKKYSLAIEAFV
ncbi:uncharacterized protein LOC131669307 isoform X1 [Phymastichus coffea]|uniref:uncharacterized protein LOC131669307 isoform X1 n=1 Tax=Phymastichus coffea TaxID=108790 RepID=UPI00273BE4DB|nr:uncharacterized protein LOC131669307 isoform X1 [Phymastichus coffea]